MIGCSFDESSPPEADLRRRRTFAVHSHPPKMMLQARLPKPLTVGSLRALSCSTFGFRGLVLPPNSDTTSSNAQLSPRANARGVASAAVDKAFPSMLYRRRQGRGVFARLGAEVGAA